MNCKELLKEVSLSKPRETALWFYIKGSFQKKCSGYFEYIQTLKMVFYTPKKGYNIQCMQILMLIFLAPKKGFKSQIIQLIVVFLHLMALMVLNICGKFQFNIRDGFLENIH